MQNNALRFGSVSFLIGFLWFVPLGCAEITPPSPSEVIESPLGKDALKLGMSRDEVREMWGEPDEVKPMSPGAWGGNREIWVYQARFPELSQVDVGYATRTKRILFEGDTLISLNPEE